MPSRRRSRNKNLVNNISEVQRRLRTLERRPVRVKISSRAITSADIAPNSVNPDHLTGGSIYVAPPGTSVEDAAADILNPKPGDIVVGSDGASAYSDHIDDYVPIFDPTVSGDIAAVQDSVVIAQQTADGKNSTYRQGTEPTIPYTGTEFAIGDIWFDTSNDSKIHKYTGTLPLTISNKSLTTNVATLTTSQQHTYLEGDIIDVTSVDSTFNGQHTITSTPSSTTFTYAVTASNVASVASTGDVALHSPWRGFFLGDKALGFFSAFHINAGEIDASHIVVSNLDASNISTGTLFGREVRVGGLLIHEDGEITTTYGIDTEEAPMPFHITSDGKLTVNDATIRGNILTSSFNTDVLPEGSLIFSTNTASPRITIAPNEVLSAAANTSDYGVSIIMDSAFGDRAGTLRMYGSSTESTLEMYPNIYDGGRTSSIKITNSDAVDGTGSEIILQSGAVEMTLSSQPIGGGSFAGLYLNTNMTIESTLTVNGDIVADSISSASTVAGFRNIIVKETVYPDATLYNDGDIVLVY